MSDRSNNRGRAYEYVFLNSLYEAIQELRPAEMIHNSSFDAGLRAWNSISIGEQSLFQQSAKSVINKIFELEPNIVEPTDDILQLYIQPDKRGEEADVRDIVIERKDIVWEVGLSLKLNNAAVKHSRLSHICDFGKEWYGVSCSKEYWEEIKPIFDYLKLCKSKELRFSDVPQKPDNVYKPILEAFLKEVQKQTSKRPSLARNLVKYLLGKYDYYKVVTTDRKHISSIYPFNMHGTLSKPSRVKKSIINLPVTVLPTTLQYIGFKIRGKTKSKTTIIMCFDNGWQFSFRLHNGEKKVEPTLKFDVQIVGIPPIVDIKIFK